MDIRFHERRGGRIDAALRYDRRAIEFVQNSASGNDRLWHARDVPIHGRHADLDCGLRPRRGRRGVV